MPTTSDSVTALRTVAGYTETTVTSGDITLAVKTWGDPANPVVVLVHGYPDNSSVWHGVAPILALSNYVIAYDVRGAGKSSKPKHTSDYAFSYLSADFNAVIDAIVPNRPVHLVGHDWGSLQSWEFATDPNLKGRIISYTSCSGPCLDHAGYWMRAVLTNPSRIGKTVHQLLKSYYIYFFHLPFVPELAWRTMFGPAWPAMMRRLEHTEIEARPTQTADGVNGVNLYRANFMRALLTPRERYAQAPVQVIVPTLDKFVSPALSEDLSRWVPTYYRRELAARHWVPESDPQRFAAAVQDLVTAVETGVEPRALARARQGKPAADKPFAGKLAVITGAGSGIGRSAAIEFARKGASIVVVDINQEAADRTAELVELLDVKAYAKRVDVGSAEEMDQFARWVGQEFGSADIVINNAGIGMAGGILSTTEKDWDRILKVNLWGVIHGSRLFAKQMIERGAGGHIINTASAAAFGPNRDLVPYGTTKAAVLMLSESMRGELAEHGIGVTAVCPGFAETNIAATTQYTGASQEEQQKKRERAAKLYQLRGLQPETIAKAMVASVLENKPVAAIGVEAHSMRFMSRYLPWLSRMIARVSMA